MGNGFNYEIKGHIAIISETDNGRYTLELNRISYNGAPAKLDLRRWDKENGVMLKGLTLTDDEAEALKEILERTKTKGIKENDDIKIS